MDLCPFFRCFGTRSEERSTISQFFDQKRNFVQKHLKVWRLWRCQESKGYVSIKRLWLFCRLLKENYHQTLNSIVYCLTCIYKQRNSRKKGMKRIILKSKRILNDYSTTLTKSSNIPTSLINHFKDSFCCATTLQRLSDFPLYNDLKTWRIYTTYWTFTSVLTRSKLIAHKHLENFL